MNPADILKKKERNAKSVLEKELIDFLGDNLDQTLDKDNKDDIIF